MKRSLMKDGGVEPHDVAVIVGQSSVIVFTRMMRLEMSMNRRVRMIGVSFVNVLGRERRQDRDVRDQDQADGSPPE